LSSTPPDPSPKAGPLRIVVMGVSGCGKTAVGRLLAGRLGAAFIDGDDLHPPENVRKMAAGIPLEDQDRRPWLDQIAEKLSASRKSGSSPVVARLGA